MTKASFVVDLRQDAIERLVDLADSAAQLLAEGARGRAVQSFLQNEIVGIVAAAHAPLRFARRLSAEIVARRSACVSMRAITVSRAIRLTDVLVPLLTLFSVGLRRWRCRQV